MGKPGICGFLAKKPGKTWDFKIFAIFFKQKKGNLQIFLKLKNEICESMDGVKV